jgi:hypothetical protein
MTTWTTDNLNQIGMSEELDLASRRADGGLSTFVTMWVVRVGDDLYVRSAGGPDRPWYQRARAAGNGTIKAGGIRREVTFATADDDAHEEIDAAYHAKYDRYGASIVGSVVGRAASDVTIRLVAIKAASDGDLRNRTLNALGVINEQTPEPTKAEDHE